MEAGNYRRLAGMAWEGQRETVARIVNPPDILVRLKRLNRLTVVLTIANTLLWIAAGVAIAFMH